MSTTTIATTMKVAQVPKPGAEFQIVDREMPEPGPGHVRIKVKACGICHSDALTKDGSWPGIQYPRVPGHEVAGVIDKLGLPAFSDWKKGQRAGCRLARWASIIPVVPAGVETSAIAGM